jgi:hypothetical protein
MKKELVFEIGADGGGITIYRIEKNSKTSYVFNLNEIDFSDEIGDQHQKDVYSTFEEAFNRIKYQYPWHLLYPIVIADKYKKIIADELIYKLNSPDSFSFDSNYKEYAKILGVIIYFEEETFPTDLYEIEVHPLFDYETSKCPLTRFSTEGKIEVLFNSIIIKGENDKIEFIIPSDKYAIETRVIFETRRTWMLK